MQLSEEAIINITQQEINDTDTTLHSMIDYEEKERRRKRDTEEKAKKRMEKMMDRKLYIVEQERNKELEDINQTFEEYLVLSSKEQEIISTWTTQQPQNVTERTDTQPSSEFVDKTPIEIFSSIMTNEVMSQIVKFTNERIEVEKQISLFLLFWRKYLQNIFCIEQRIVTNTNSRKFC